MSGALHRLEAWWGRQPVAERARWHGVVLCGVVYLVHYTLLSVWYIEDAAISFSFARHLASGEGFVAYPGGERVEGFSNPSWTLLLALVDLLGINPWVAAKLLGAVFGLITLPPAYLWARRLTGEPHGLLPVLAPLLLALSPQFVIWNASGLENSLLNACLAFSAILLLREVDQGGFPWSAMPLGLLAITRPDAPLYCGIAAGLAVLFALRARGLAALPWASALAALSLSPLIAWEAFSLWYFAWPFPATYYAKLHDMDRFVPFDWDAFCWKYTRGWALRSAWGFLLPFAGPLLTGLRGPRAPVGYAVAGVLVAVLLPGLAWPQLLVTWSEPDALVQTRVLTLAAVAALLPLAGLGRPGDVERTLAWYLLAGAVFFALYAGGDWMSGWRWFATAQVPLAVLLPDFLARGIEVLPRARRLLVGLLAGPVLIAGVVFAIQNLTAVETSPYDVYQRVRYMAAAQEKLHVDHVVNMEVDFGAQMWWAGDELIDMAGLNDIPIAIHDWEQPFMREYIFHERRPDFAHVHGNWRRKAGMHRQPAFRQQYVEIPGYPVSKRSFHVGNHVRKDLFVWGQADLQARISDEGRSRTGRFGPVRLVGLDLPAPRVAAGQTLFVQIAWESVRGEAPRDVRPVLFLAGEGRWHTWELPPGYDWYPIARWRRGEVVVGRHSLPLPADLPVGTYTVGLFVTEPGGPVLAAEHPAEAPLYARGEVHWAQAVEVASLDDVIAHAGRLQEEALELASSGRCHDADAVLQRARRHLRPDHPAQPWSQAAVIDGFAQCWAAEAERAPTPEQAEAAIYTARRWDHRHPEVQRVGRSLADRWEEEGQLAVDAGDLDSGYQSWRRALIADPTRSWLRRSAEAVRDQRLGLAEGDG